MQEKQSPTGEHFSNSLPHALVADEIGEKAANLASQQGFSGSAVSIGSAVVYLEGPGDEIIWLSNRSVSFHRRSIRGSFAFEGLTAGQSFSIKEKMLLIGNNFRLDLSRAKKRPLIDPDPRSVISWTMAKQVIRQFLKTLKQVDGAKGLGVLLQPNESSSPNRDSPSLFNGEFINRSKEIIQQIADASVGGGLREITQLSQQLIGLGPGLTPSGDDFIGGMFFVFHWLEKAYPRRFNWRAISKESLVANAHAGTNKISFTILSDLIQGHGPQPLHSLLSGLFLGERALELLKAVHSLARIGHSSGWDMLAGVASGLLIVGAPDNLQEKTAQNIDSA